MSYKGILVHVEPTQDAEARVACAASLADRFGAVVIGSGSEMISVQGADPLAFTDGGLLTLMSRQVDEHLAQAKVTFERVVGGRPHHWISEQAMPDEALSRAARAADLIVTSRAPKGREDPLRNEDPGLLVVISGRPVLVVPPGKEHLAAERILVCWKDSRESRRAIADALPFLKRAQEVLVVEVASSSDLSAACARTDEVAEALRRHGVRASGEGIIADERRTATLLLHRADSFDADLIVSGGYGRSRLGEWAFGGVTKSLLDQTERFVLLSH